MTHSIRPHPLLGEYYGSHGERPVFVRSLFNNTARYYDQVNWLFSLGTGEWYRRHALRRAGLRPGMRLLDIATGTGLVARAAQDVLGKGADVVGLDPTEQMLHEARRKLAIPLIQARAESIPLPDASVDFITMGYALRHMGDLAVAFTEFRRVLRSGGRLLMLEIGRPEGRFAHAVAAAYLGRLLPSACRWLRPGTDLDTLMRYHWDTIEHCVAADAVLSQLRACGFTDVVCETELGVFRAYRSRNPVGTADRLPHHVAGQPC